VTFGGLALGAWVWGLVSDLAGLPLAIRSAALLLLVSLPLLRWLAPMPARDEGRVAL
jgi:predicted MFS family arabinose efflux permease